MGFSPFIDLSFLQNFPFSLMYGPSSSPTPLKLVQHKLAFSLTTPYSRPSPNVHFLNSLPNAADMPLEVIISILEAAYFDNDLEPNHSLLAKCALVCKDWRAPAQKLLFSHVTLRTKPACKAFQSATNPSTAIGRMLGGAVVRLRIILDHNQPFPIDHHSFSQAFASCSNLYELDLSLYGIPRAGEHTADSPTLARLRRLAPIFDQQTISTLASGPKFSALGFNNWTGNEHCINQLLPIWPSLKCVRIGGTPPQCPSSYYEPLPHAFEELRMNFQVSPSIEFAKWMLENSSESLRVLEFEREPSSHLLEYLLTSHHATLHSLHLPTCSSPEQERLVQLCTQLKEFGVENPRSSGSVYKRLPPGVEHLAFGMDNNTSINSMSEIVRTRRSLKAVTVHLWDRADQHPHLSTLKMACVFQGVDLRISSEIGHFRKLLRGDPVSSDSYPRVTSLENLRAMRS